MPYGSLRFFFKKHHLYPQDLSAPSVRTVAWLISVLDKQIGGSTSALDQSQPSSVDLMVDSKGGWASGLMLTEYVLYWHLVVFRQDYAHILLAQVHDEISPNTIDHHVMYDSLLFSLT